MRRFFRDNSLTLAFLGLFLACLAGQALSGYALQSEDPAGQSHSAGRLAYLLDASFLKGVLANWQAALLQLLMLIVLSVFLRQRGASHSRRPDDEAAPREPHDHLRRLGHSRSWAYAHSLTLAFLALFVASFVGFFFADAAVYNQNRVRLGEAPLGLGRSLVSADFWFQTFQTWQAEFFAMAVFLILSVVLRQEGSAESKRVEAGDDETGATNE